MQQPRLQAQPLPQPQFGKDHRAWIALEYHKRKDDRDEKNWKIDIFQNLTYQLQTQFSQLPNGQIAKFQCLSDAEFPEFFKNGLTFYHSPFLLGVIVKKPCPHFFWDTLYILHCIEI